MCYKQRTFIDVDSKEFVQIMAVSHSRWMTNSTTGCQPSQVCIHKDVPTRTREQIAAFLCSTVKVTTLEFVPVQVQEDGTDCGIVLATWLCKEMLSQTE